MIIPIRRAIPALPPAVLTILNPSPVIVAVKERLPPVARHIASLRLGRLVYRLLVAGIWGGVRAAQHNAKGKELTLVEQVVAAVSCAFFAVPGGDCKGEG